MAIKSFNIPNKFILNMLDAKFTATETRVLLCIAFYTFGINSEFCPLSYGFLSDATHIDESDIKKIMRKLEKRQIIKNYKNPGNQNKNLWGIDKDFYLYDYKAPETDFIKELEKLHQCNDEKPENEPRAAAEKPGEPRAAGPSAEDPGRTKSKAKKKKREEIIKK